MDPTTRDRPLAKAGLESIAIPTSGAHANRHVRQQDRVLALLHRGPVCSTTLLGEFIPRGAALVHRLRRAGHPIITRPCSRPGHRHDTPQVEYVLGLGLDLGYDS